MKTAILLNDELFLLWKIKREKLDIRAVYSIEEKNQKRCNVIYPLAFIFSLKKRVEIFSRFSQPGV